MSSYTVRSLESSDYEHLMKLEEEIFGASGEDTLCPHYVRLCCEFYGDTCFLVFRRGKPIGYLLSFVKDRTAFCTTMAVHPEYQGGRTFIHLIRAFLMQIVSQVDTCVFTVKPDNASARAIHKFLGAKVVATKENYYGAGDTRLLCEIDRPTFRKLASRYAGHGLPAEKPIEVAA